MNILHVIHKCLWGGGIETYLLTLLPLQAAQGSSPSILCTDAAPDISFPTTRLPELNVTSRAAERLAYLRVTALLRRLAPDVIHLHNIHSRGTIRACLDSAATVMTAHNYSAICPAQDFFKEARQTICTRTCGPACFPITVASHCMSRRPLAAIRSYRRVRWMVHNADRFDAIIAPTPYVSNRYITAGFPKDRVVTLPYFCPVSPLKAVRPLPRRRLITFMGRIRPYKGYLDFIRLLAALPTDVTGLLVGDHSKSTSYAINTLAESLQCHTRLILRPWADRSDIRNTFRETSVFVFPSVWPETLGIVGLESLACGVPVVAYDVGGISHWLQHEHTGLLVTPKDVTALAHATRHLLGNADLNVALGSNGLTLIAQHYGTDDHLTRLQCIYERAADHRAASHRFAPSAAGSQRN